MTSGLVLLLVLGLALCLTSLVYLALAIRAALARGERGADEAARQPPVTVLKPVCGLEPELYDSLRSFCDQDYPVYQVIFGVRDAADPAIHIIERLIRDCPNRDLELVVDERIIGTNYKISNLTNMYRQARHDIILIADSDTRVDETCLATVVASFDDPAVGAVTCLYRGVPGQDLPSTISAMFINDWFAPSVLVSLTFQELSFCFGALMGVRRAALGAIGGLETLAHYLADDYMLGQLISREGFKVALSSYVVENRVHEPSFKHMVLHELRWARTMRTMRPTGYLMSFVTDAVPLAALLTMVTAVLVPDLRLPGLPLDFDAAFAGLTAIALALRIQLHYAMRQALGVTTPTVPWLVPVRDLASSGIRVASFVGRGVSWRGQQFSVQPDGTLHART